MPPLTSYDEFDKNQEYQGFVVRLIKSGILVAFYGDVRGFLPVKNLNLEKGVDILQTFKIGEFVSYCDGFPVGMNGHKTDMSILFQNGQDSVRFMTGSYPFIPP